MTETSQTQTKPQLDGVGAWLKSSFQYVGANWWMLIKVYLYSMLMYFGVALVAALAFGLAAFLVALIGGLMGIKFPPADMGSGVLSAGVALLFFVAYIGMLVVFLATAGKMILTQIAAVIEPVKSIRGLWQKFSWKEGLGFYWLMLLMIFSIYGGFFLLIIPGIIISTWVSLAIYVKYNQKVGGLQALMISRDYVSGYWWEIFWRWFVAGLALIAVAIVPMFAYVKMTEMGGLWAFLGFVIYMLTIGLVSSLAYRLGHSLYLNLVKIKGEITLKASGWRTFGWSLLAYFPFVALILATVVLIAVNPAKQMQKARDQAEQDSDRQLERIRMMATPSGKAVLNPKVATPSPKTKSQIYD